MTTLVPAIRRFAARTDDVLRDFPNALLHPYRRDLHYMRGPGPKWHAKRQPKPKGPLTRALDLLARWRQTMVEVRASRVKLESELFRNRYHISSKNDDDLPVVS